LRQQTPLEHTPLAQAPQSTDPPHPSETGPQSWDRLALQTLVGLHARIRTGTVVVRLTLEAMSVALTWKF
jgi:hypothetical protein